MKTKFKYKLKPVSVIVLGAVVGLLTITQIERFITQGLLLGYQVRQKPLIANTPSKRMQLSAEKSRVCQKLNTKTVQRLINQPVEVTAGFSSFTSGDNEFSSCAYRTTDKNKPTRNISVGERVNKKNADQALEKVHKNNGEDVDIAGKKAVWQAKSGQLTIVQEETVYTITVSGGDQSSKKQIAVQVAEALTK